jgi:nucleotide-binding universal stress UspA family protein
METKKRQLLVPVNFTDYSDNGAIYALNVARYLDADIILLNSYLEPVMAVPGLFEPFTYATATNSLKTLEDETAVNLMATKFMLEGIKSKMNIENVNINYDLVHGFPGNSILSYAEQFNVDAIVMGFENPEGFSKFGSITSIIIEKSCIPVLAVPQGYDANKFKKPEKVLYLTNIDEYDEKALKRLSELIRFFDSSIICVHSCLGESSEEEEMMMHKFKNNLLKKFNISNIECGILETGDIIKGLIKFINKREIDVLAMNAKKRNILSRLFSSNFTEKLLYQTNVPLLVYHISE